MLEDGSLLGVNQPNVTTVVGGRSEAGMFRTATGWVGAFSQTVMSFFNNH